MKKQGPSSVGIVLSTLFFLLTACSTPAANTANTQQGNIASPTASTTVETSRVTIDIPTAIATKSVATKNAITPTVRPGSNMTLPSQSVTQPPSLSPTPTSTIQATMSPTAIPTISTGNGTPGTLSQAAHAVFMLINQERASAGLPALTMSNALMQSAHKHNLAMLETDQLSHQLSGEANLGKRISAQGVKWTMVAENIGYGFGDVTQTAMGLNRSMFAEKLPDDGHRKNILSRNTIVGIDVVVNTQNSQVWLTEDFARTA